MAPDTVTINRLHPTTRKPEGPPFTVVVGEGGRVTGVGGTPLIIPRGNAETASWGTWAAMRAAAHRELGAMGGATNTPLPTHRNTRLPTHPSSLGGGEGGQCHI